MKKEVEKRDIKLNHDTKTNKITIQYNRIIETDPESLPNKIRNLTDIIAQMEHHYQTLGNDIESAKKELQLLEKLSDDLNIA